MKLDTIEDQQEKRFNRFLLIKGELLEMSQQLEHDLNYFADYLGSEDLFEANKHATVIYHIVNKVGEN